MQLGELEKLVLQYLWSHKEADAKSVHNSLAEVRDNSLNTIQSTLERLHKKKLLCRSKQGHAYIYRSKVDRNSLMATLIMDITADFVEEGENSLIAAFSSTSTNFNDTQLDELEQLIDQQRKLRKGLV
jgi:predicted transcriptional regulator